MMVSRTVLPLDLGLQKFDSNSDGKVAPLIESVRARFLPPSLDRPRRHFRGQLCLLACSSLQNELSHRLDRSTQLIVLA